ncbi:MAG TPA: response regulator transcription factor [Panacibacter sp.]|nr:response regulator transcription factor [Panacibacter sp.]HNP46698.1 response regulator transcription factor [Panacibacter sp.]
MNIRVAIFEDNHNLRDGLFQLINGSYEFQCVGAYANCNSLLRNIEESKPHVVLMDIEMPGMNGIEAVKLLKEKHPDVKILMETIFEDNEKIFQSICNGAEGYILKNTSPVQILSAIKEIYEGGAPMTPSIATKVLKMFKNQSSHDSKNSFDLTDREKEILKCLVEGMSYKLIADHCYISLDTVSGHIKNIYKKLQVHSKSEAVVKAIKGRIV